MEEGEPAVAKITLPDTVRDYIDTCIEGYGPSAVVQGFRDCCAKRAEKHGLDATRLTAEQRRYARLWNFAKKDTEHLLRDLLDHGPESGCI